MNTFPRSGLMVTPRGYANKYDALTGKTLAGEQSGRSLSMGLEGWKSCVRSYLREHPKATLLETAAYFAQPLGEILAAVAEAALDDPAGIFTATAVTVEQRDNVLAAVQNWGKLRAVVRAEAGAVAELFVQGADLQLKNGWGSIVNDHFHLHVDWRNAEKIWFVSRGDETRGIQIVDAQGGALLNLWLMADQAVDSQSLAHYARDKAKLTANKI